MTRPSERMFRTQTKAAVYFLAMFAICIGQSGCLFDLSDDDDRYRMLVGTQWSMDIMTVGGTNYSDPDEDHFTVAFTDSTVSGRGDCNIWSSTYTYDTNGLLTLNGISSTEVACPPGSFEETFYDMLTRTTQYSADDDLLVFSAPNGDRIVFEEED